MELEDLQNMWIQYDKNLSDNTRLNKEILKRMLILKPEKRLNGIKIKAGFKLILAIAMIIYLFVRVQYRPTIDFYIGVLLFGMLGLLAFSWQVSYFVRLGKIDFSNSITLIKKDLKELEKYKIKITKFAYFLMPLGAAGIFMIGEIPIFSKHFLLPLSLIILIMFSSIYYTFKYSIFEQFKKLNLEIDEIEQLEK
jgi:hypothetical protein